MFLLTGEKEWAEKFQRAETEHKDRADFVLFSRSQTPKKLLDVSKMKFPYNPSACWVTWQHSPVCFIHLWAPNTKLGGQHRKGSVNICWLGRWMGNACLTPQGSSCRQQRQCKEKSLLRAGAPAMAQEFCLDWPWKDKKNQPCSL